MKYLKEILSSVFDYEKSSKSSLLFRFWSTSAIYAITSLLARLGNFILLPIYWNHLGPSEFGILAVCEIVTMGLTGIMTLCLEAAVTRSFHEWKPEERSKHLGGIWLTALAGAFALAGIFYGVAQLAWEDVIHQVPFKPYVQLAILSALARSFSNIPFALLRVREQLYRFSLIHITTFVLSACVGIRLVVFQGWGARGILWASIAGYGMTALVWMFYMGRQIAMPTGRDHVVPHLKYSAPLVPTLLIGLAALLCDRFFLDRYVPLAEIGLFAVAARIVGVVKEANQSLKNSWVPFATRLLIERPDGAQVMARLSKYYFAALTLVALTIGLLGGELIRGLAPEKYLDATRYLPLLLLAALVEPIDVFAGIGLSFKRRTGMILLLAVLEAAITLTLIGLMTSAWGAAGTCVGILAARFTGVATRFLLCLKVHPVPYELGRWIGLLVLALATFGIGMMLPPMDPWISALTKCGLLAVFSLGAAWLFLDLGRALELLRERRAAAP